MVRSRANEYLSGQLDDISYGLDIAMSSTEILAGPSNAIHDQIRSAYGRTSSSWSVVDPEAPTLEK